MVGYFDDLAEALNQGRVEEDALTDIARRHSMEVLGSVPEGYL
jgi:hypothetical protein